MGRLVKAPALELWVWLCLWNNSCPKFVCIFYKSLKIVLMKREMLRDWLAACSLCDSVIASNLTNGPGTRRFPFEKMRRAKDGEWLTHVHRLCCPYAHTFETNFFINLRVFFSANYHHINFPSKFQSVHDFQCIVYAQLSGNLVSLCIHLSVV